MTDKLVSREPVRQTLEVMADAGVMVEASDDLMHFRVESQSYRSGEFRVNGDWPGSAALLAAGALTADGIAVEGLLDDNQGERAAADVLRTMGASITRHEHEIRVARAPLTAVDFDGDGRRDLVGSVPDALASTANYLKRSGWRTGEPWGYEVRVPAGVDTAMSGRTSRRPLSYWTGRGISRVDGTSIAPLETAAALVMPAGRAGPAFLVFKNFDAIYSYNASESYAFAIALLANRLRGQGGLVTAWPTNDPGLSRRERRELQALLLQRGHDIGEVDGMIGSASRVAITSEQQRLGMPADGRAGQGILAALKKQAQIGTGGGSTR